MLLPVAVTWVQLLVVAYKFWQSKLLLLGPAASLRMPQTVEQSTTATVRDSTLTLRQFGSRLKTHLFSLACGGAS